MDRRAWLILIAGICAVAGLIVVRLFSPANEHSRTQSPDGTFTAIAHTQPIYALIAVMPGQGSDKPGRVTVYRGSEACGSAWVPMVWMARELRWEVDVRPRRAEIKLVATWNLDACVLMATYSGYR